MKARLTMTVKAAEGLAIQALTFIASEPERLGHFLAETGIGPAEIRAAAREPGFLAGVLDYLASDERLAAGFAVEACIDPAMFEQARAVFDGVHPKGEMP